MDVVVWQESEERERWWREIVGITTTGDRCATTVAGEQPRTLSVTPRRRDSAPASLHAVTAA
ncbi:hypothetical protein [Rhodococcus sp. IEGM 1318]|uniref:hypothetical protein n=1 Tax=Rhodococcus sp. IEGM 1318 TaxID=3082226 RepID=UPI002955A9E3|nr:hypothetical protein [Rhodococcus sp. IEGM 1318]MDV8009209.1 hypothetical protein [Rhodococcus sp. IEGM 1318]